MVRKRSEASDRVIVLTTAGSEEQSVEIAEALVDRKLAACVNILPKIRSIYRWKNKIWDDEEFLLVIKTTRPAFPRVREAIKSIHSYELPEILVLPLVDGDIGSLQWIGECVNPATRPITEEESVR
ncbi:MAG: divalent-cation tolerance protein CutA [Acidobacteriota bacterium]